MPSARINNIDCYYEIYGNGSPFVLIPGLASDSQSWQSMLGGLAKHFKVVVFDNRVWVERDTFQKVSKFPH